MKEIELKRKGEREHIVFSEAKKVSKRKKKRERERERTTEIHEEKRKITEER
jgi:hypothetical protein